MPDMKKTERYEEQNLVSFWQFKFKDAMVHKSKETELWNQYWDAYRGDYFNNKSLPEYKSNLVSNYIFSVIETIRPIMLDNDPKFQATPRQPEGMQHSNDLQEVFSYEWDREYMTRKLYRELITTLVIGTSVWFLPWSKEERNVKAIPVNPFNIFPDPLATDIDDAEYIIYAKYFNAEKLRRLFPNKAEHLIGSDVNYGELVHDNNQDARLDNQILVLEIWTRDYETKEVDENGNVSVKYPKGRVITMCPELGIVLEDKGNPYEDGKFPFELMKDYDIPGKFWGEGEVAQLISPQKYMNELGNAIIDNAKTTANSPWIIDKNSGIGYNKITSRQGLVIRKNPGTEVRREQAPTMPAYVINAVETFKGDMEQISGVFDTLRGNSETGVYTAQGILALQEAGQARVRLKVKLMEDSLGCLANKWLSRMKQFWKEDRWIRVAKLDGRTDLKKFTQEKLSYDYDVRVSAGSTMPVNRGAMLDLMIRLAQTQMPDGQMLVDRESVVQYLPQEARSALLQRMAGSKGAIEGQIEELGQALQQLTQQLQQVSEESQGNDQQTFSVIEDLTGALETVNKQILQISKSHDKMVEDKKREEERNKIRTDAYNEGYKDAERLTQSDENESVMEASTEGVSDEPLPDDILQGLENMTDDELALLVMQNPEIAQLLNQ